MSNGANAQAPKLEKVLCGRRCGLVAWAVILPFPKETRHTRVSPSSVALVVGEAEVQYSCQERYLDRNLGAVFGCLCLPFSLSGSATNPFLWSELCCPSRAKEPEGQDALYF